MEKAFSLVELSIVLVILGLLTGGILTGQSLIKAAELRSITTEYSEYQIAIHNFREKFGALPGDIIDATSYWGKLSAYCNTATGIASATGTCNGDGNGIIAQDGASAGQESEGHLLWQHLSLAGLIYGTYTGIAGPVDDADDILGVNVPASDFPDAGWNIDDESYTTGEATRFAGNYGKNHFEFGADKHIDTDDSVMTTEQAWNIDKKMDDGNPGTGNIMARYWNNACANASSNTNYTASYRLQDKTIQCALVFKEIF